MRIPAPAFLMPLFLASATVWADETTGEQIYRKMCISCHGANGEGSKDHPEALVGDRSLDKLALYIAKSMPEDTPGKCVGDDAKKVADYIYNAFYSRAAQARNKPRAWRRSFSSCDTSTLDGVRRKTWSATRDIDPPRA